MTKTGNSVCAVAAAQKDREYYLVPAVDAYTTHDEMVLIADVPGLDEKSLSISVEDGVMTIEGCASAGLGELLYREFTMTGYRRQFQVGDSFDAANARAEIKDGVLTLTIPKAEAAKPRRIKVSVH
jgi:HSP20 family molecular chaperone IbpA